MESGLLMTQDLMIFACVSHRMPTCQISISILHFINLPRQHFLLARARPFSGLIAQDLFLHLLCSRNKWYILPLISPQNEANNFLVVQRAYGRHAWDLTLASITNHEQLVRRLVQMPLISWYSSHSLCHLQS